MGHNPLELIRTFHRGSNDSNSDGLAIRDRLGIHPPPRYITRFKSIKGTIQAQLASTYIETDHEFAIGRQLDPTFIASIGDDEDLWRSIQPLWTKRGHAQVDAGASDTANQLVYSRDYEIDMKFERDDPDVLFRPRPNSFDLGLALWAVQHTGQANIRWNIMVVQELEWIGGHGGEGNPTWQMMDEESNHGS